MKLRLALATFLVSSAALMAPAVADPVCTTEPKDKWVSEEVAKAKIAEMGYKDIRKFKVTETGCYEIYGYDKDGRKAEVYFNPVTMDVVEAEIEE